MGSPVDDALDRLENFAHTHEFVGDTDIAAAQEALATVRSELAARDKEIERLREERDALERKTARLEKDLSDLSNANDRLRLENHRLRKHVTGDAGDAEVLRLREGLHNIETGSIPPPYAGVRGYARALLATDAARVPAGEPAVEESSR